jgi:galactoside O-acetyltransferase
MRTGLFLPGFKDILSLIPSAALNVLESWIFFVPGPTGFFLRRVYYARRLKHMGEGVLIDAGVCIQNPRAVSIGDYVLLSNYVTIEGGMGVTLGKRIHVASYSLIQGSGTVEIGDYAVISAGCRIYSGTSTYEGGRRMTSPMLPYEQNYVRKGKITIGKDAFLGVGTIVMPGVTIGEGAIVGAGALVLKDIPPWTIAVGVPARPIKKRPHINL